MVLHEFSAQVKGSRPAQIWTFKYALSVSSTDEVRDRVKRVVATTATVDHQRAA